MTFSVFHRPGYVFQRGHWASRNHYGIPAFFFCVADLFGHTTQNQRADQVGSAGEEFRLFIS
ncbi:hypothetical protein [Spirosoma sp.]|uniref:hypothetical protein n=1 Tax=Spirosoma sp. TaxID=1899569 RepID=UPI003B3AFBB1